MHLLRNSQIGAYVYPVVPSEFSNWRDEQRAWRETAVLFDQSHHMAELTVRGPDALRLMSHTTINSFAGFTPNRAKQMVPVSYDGHVIGDGILFLTPYELGYGAFVKFDHDFIGREALERKAGEPHRKKVTLAWNGADLATIYASLFVPGEPNYKFFDLPIANYASSSYDAVTRGGRTVGLSMFGATATTSARACPWTWLTRTSTLGMS